MYTAKNTALPQVAGNFLTCAKAELFSITYNKTVRIQINVLCCIATSIDEIITISYSVGIALL